MATLLLTTVGGAIGGPIGAALGGLLGQAVDRDVLFRPKGRQGPRLTELAVQTSSYGTMLPRLFGTMRVAGCVIWSTDLIESKSKSSAGKGQPKVTSYSYAASFAVALSARPIAAIGRIWADGKLLRGSADDFKSQIGAFRFHDGSENQAVDPLIASAEGVTLTPAHRGSAYAVFEQLQLADFGNRLPSLTFEVIADSVPPGIGSIAAELSDGVVVDEGVAMPLGGFSAYGDSVRGVLEVLADASGAWWAPVGDGLAITVMGEPAAALSDDGVAAEGAAMRGGSRKRAVAAIDSVAKTLTVSHYDPARDYQTGMQRARRPGAGDRAESVDLPAAVEAATAKGIAEAMLARAETMRVRRTIAMAAVAIGTAPGDVVTIAGEAGTWRVDEASLEGMVVTLELVPLAPAPVAAGADAGRVLAAPDLTAGATILHAFETPSLDDAVLAQPRLTIVAAGTAPGWRSAALLVSTDDGASWQEAGSTAAPATVGTVFVPPGSGATAIRDLSGTIDVELAHAGMALANADDAAVDAGANLALVGDELVQFGMATPLGGTRWRLSRLLRGRRGTETLVGSAAASSRFVLLAREAAVTLDLPLATLGTGVRVMASGIGDLAGPVEATTIVTGVTVRPPSPVALRATASGDGGTRLDWVRRSRAGWRWIDGVDAPLAEETERYRVTVRQGSGAERETIVEAPTVLIDADERDGGVAQVAVQQIGINGDSPPATITLAAA